MSQHLVITGNVVDGHFFYGPFPTRDDAEDWGEAECDGDEWVAAPLVGQAEYARTLGGAELSSDEVELHLEATQDIPVTQLCEGATELLIDIHSKLLGSAADSFVEQRKLVARIESFCASHSITMYPPTAVLDKAIEQALEGQTIPAPRVADGKGDSVPMPQNAKQAELMLKMGTMWLEAHSPNVLTPLAKLFCEARDLLEHARNRMSSVAEIFNDKRFTDRGKDGPALRREIENIDIFLDKRWT